MIVAREEFRFWISFFLSSCLSIFHQFINPSIEPMDNNRIVWLIDRFRSIGLSDNNGSTELCAKNHIPAQLYLHLLLFILIYMFIYWLILYILLYIKSRVHSALAFLTRYMFCLVWLLCIGRLIAILLTHIYIAI